MDGWITIGTELDTKSFDKQIKSLERKLNDYVSDLEAMSKEEGFNEQSQEVLELQKNIEILTNKIGNLRQKQAELNKQGMPNISQMTNDIANKTENVIKKVAKWGLAIFSVRSAYMFIRQSVSTLSQYNEKIGTDIEYIRYALSSSLQPIIENIIQLMYKMLAYINYISQAWFGVNIFANASAKAFGNVKKNLGGANKSAKELQKTLLGFDEMNILQDGSTTTGGGGGGISLPSMDLANMQNVEIPAWIKWIADNGAYIATILGAIGAAIAGIKLTTFIGGLLGATESLASFSLGVGAILGGLVLLGGSIANLIINWDNMTIAQKEAAIELASLGGALVGIGLAITGLVSGPFGALIAIFSVLAGGIADVIIKNNEDEKSMLSAKDAANELKNAKDKLRQANNQYVNALDDAKKASEELTKAEKKYKLSGEELFNAVVVGTKSVDNMTTAELEVYKAYLNNEGAQKSLKDATDELNKSKVEAANMAQQESAAIYKETQEYQGYFKTLLDGYNQKKIGDKELVDGTLAVMSKMDEATRKTFAENLPQNVKDAFDSVRQSINGAGDVIETFEDGTEISYKSIVKATKQTFEKDVPNSIDKSINKVKSLTSALSGLASSGVKGGISVSVKSTSGSKNAKGAIYYPPKLATGGIINMPGRGVPLGAIGGEKGPEGVIPLTDQEAMSRLGAEIGRNVVINTILNNYMNSRLISREQQKTSNIDSFAFNR